jgi:capsular polysaccharide export protein
MMNVVQSKQHIYALNFSSWKRSVVKQFFADCIVKFIQDPSTIPECSTLVVWGYKDDLCELPVATKIIRLEDGFLRSVGLGADLTRPMSWVADMRGIYFDASRPSDLEYLLGNNSFSNELLTRADKLHQLILSTGITKYNLDAKPWQRPEGNRHVILVPGQVESDASIKYGAPEIATNVDLLRAVRIANPHSYIVYKPHPDVVAGLRSIGKNEQSAVTYCDEVLPTAAMHELLMAVDEVHVLTSLAGFEALLRGKPVTCYGQPFYAGWGLTQDKVPITRRVRILSLRELIAGALIVYPKYLSRDGGKLISAEEAVDELSFWQAQPSAPGWWLNVKRFVLRKVVGVK